MFRVFFIFALFAPLSSLVGGSVSSPQKSLAEESRFFTMVTTSARHVYVGSVQELYGLILQSYELHNWQFTVPQCLILLQRFPQSVFTEEVIYYLASSYFHLKEYELANLQFTQYLTHYSAPKHFREAIEYKFLIAEEFRKGARKHLLGFKSMPRWLSGYEEALAAYDEVIAALPHDDIAAKALFGKGAVLVKNKQFRESIEVYQTLIRRFPKHPLAVESYLQIGKTYFKQSQVEFFDPDLLDLAEINLGKFRQHFPLEERLSEGEESLKQMKEHYASNLFNIARFYERTKKWGAAKIYYLKVISSYPGTTVVEKCHERLSFVEKKLATSHPQEGS